MYQAIAPFWRRHDLTVLLTLYVFSLPIGNSMWLPLIIMSASGLYYLYRDARTPGCLREFGVGWWILLALLVPALLSTFDSHDIERSVKFVAGVPLLFAVGYYLYRRVRQVSLIPSAWLIALICIGWSVTIYIQFFVEGSPFGPSVGGRYQGVFGREDMIAGYAMAPLLAFLLFTLYPRRPLTTVVSGLFIAGAIFISGNRAAWVSLAVIMPALGLAVLLRGYRPSWRQAAVSGLILLTLGGSLYAAFKDTALGSRVAYTLSFLEDPGFQSINNASAGRAQIWRVAVAIGSEHWINGAGVRSFRYVYPEFAEPGDHFVKKIEDPGSEHAAKGALYPHQLLLQVFADTGLPGLLGILLIYGLLLTLCLRAAKAGNWLACGAGLAFWAGFFPLNTHLNFYGGYLMASFWIWIGLLIGLTTKPNPWTEA
jgi:O-antigen ligase